MSQHPIYITRDGERIECEEMFSFDCSENGRHYVVFTDNSRDESGAVQMFAARYEDDDEGRHYFDLESEAEWALVNGAWAQVQEQAAKFRREAEAEAEKTPARSPYGNTFTTVADGREVTFDVLLTYECVANGKNYIVYTDQSERPDGNTNVFASVMVPEGAGYRLGPIETEEEWTMIEKVLETTMEERRRKRAEEQ